MEIIISNNANKPIYEQITSQIKAMIMSGELQAGDAIPSMRALAKSIHVSVITVQKAYEDLQRDGFIETTVGRGSFVSAQNKEFYQEEQQRIAEEHLQAAAEIGRVSNISLEKLVVEQLVKGPLMEGAYPTINPSTKIISVSVKDGICYVNLGSDFLSQPNSVSAEVTIYSITNSLVELSNVNKVQISIGGETNVTYREKIDLNNLFERNLDLLVTP